MKWLAVTLLLTSTAYAQDLKDRFNIRVIATGFLLAESQNDPNPDPMAARARTESSSLNLAYGDLRIVMDARRLPGSFELHLDARVRITDDFNYDGALVQANQYTSRGYYGGREYELREAYVRRRGKSFDFALGRMFVLEADALKLDGGRLWYRFGKNKWDFSLFAGGYPNPFSRSLTTDYQGSDAFNSFTGSRYNGPAIVGGADLSYVYDKYWGSLAIVGSYLGGHDDGGPVNVTPGMGTVNNLQTELTRTYLAWFGYERFVHWLDIHHDLVLDVAGAGGVQLTRLNVFATARAHKYFSMTAGYDHLSPLAIEMYLTSLLTGRNLFIAGTINNNLVVARTARDQARFNLDVHYKLLSIFADGRLRWRSLQNTLDDPQFINPMNANNTAYPNMAYDATLGLRDRGSLKGIRFGLWFTYLGDFRANSEIVGVELGRSFLDERLTFDLQYLFAHTRDAGAAMTGAAACPVNGTFGTGLTTAGCYGTRDGNSYETGLTITGLPSRHWFLMVDYRLVANEQQQRPILLTHILLFRLEARY